MTDGRFEKLVNLYLDKEISPEELSDLKAEIAHNLVRRQKFERLCRVHSASRKALIDHSSRSGVSKFLKEEVSTVQSRRGQSSRIRRAGTEEEVHIKAREVLWRGTFAFMAIVLAAGLVTAYLIDRTARTLQERKSAEDNDERTLDMSALREGLAHLGHTDQFILAAMPAKRSGAITEFYVLRWETAINTPMDETAPSGQWTILELTKSLSPTEAYIIETQLKQCEGMLPGTSAPAAIPAPTSPVLLTGGSEIGMSEGK